jgi:hypothetical protein
VSVALDMSRNTFADTDEPFKTNAIIPSDVAEIYCEMQQKIFDANCHHPMFNKPAYSNTEADFQEAFAAGFEQADRCQEVFGTMTFNNHNPTGIRSSTGIRFAMGFASKAFDAGFNARKNQ